MTDILSTLFGTDSLLIGTIVPFLFVLLIVIFVHETGHYLVGRWCGIGVQAFSIGFGPELVGFNDRHGTRWKLSAIPLGGYVKFVGDMGAVSTPDQNEIDRLTPAERRIAFHTQPVWKRALTVFAGPAFNFILTIAVFTMIFWIYGGQIRQPTVAQVVPDSPAAAAGFLPGDRFVSIDGEPVETFDDVKRIVSGRGGDELVFVMLRGGAELTLRATPQPTEQDDGFGNKVKVAAIGIVNDTESGQPQLVQYGLAGAFGQALEETGHVVERTGLFLKRFVVGREDRCQLSGPIKIAKMSGQAASLGVQSLVILVAFLSVGIGILNLLPIPPLDGGHLAFYAIEAVIRRPVSGRMVDAFYRAGFFVVLGFMGFVFWNDIFGC